MANFLTGFAWGLFVKWMKAGHASGNWPKFSTNDVANVLLGYSIVKGASQFMTGFAADRVGRRWIVSSGLVVCSVSLVYLTCCGEFMTSYTQVYACFISGAVFLGAGTGLLYPNLQAAICDHTAPIDRGTAYGVYRFWRDIGFAIGAVTSGTLRDATGSFPVTIGIVAGITFAVAAIFGLVYRDKLGGTTGDPAKRPFIPTEENNVAKPNGMTCC